MQRAVRKFSLPTIFGLLLSLFNSSNLFSQKISFDFFLWGNKIGELTATREVKEDSSEFFAIRSHSKAKILWIVRENETLLEVTYKNGVLISSLHKEYDGGKLKNWAVVKWNSKTYDVQTEKGKRVFSEAPKFSIVSVYFKNVVGAKIIFDEALAEFYPFQNTETDTYEYKTSSGNRYVYIFQNGKLNEMEFHVSIATVKAKRRN